MKYGRKDELRGRRVVRKALRGIWLQPSRHDSRHGNTGRSLASGVVVRQK